MRIMGMDEAGRGCVIGPMVLAGVIVEEVGYEQLVKMNLKDSKKLSPKKRESFKEKIDEIAIATGIYYAFPEKIDEYCYKKLLNLMEAEAFASLVHWLCPNIVYIDAPGKIGKDGIKFEKQIKSMVDSSCQIIAENFADEKYPIVAAASIIAKTRRDQEIRKLQAIWGDFGSGYPSDEKTSDFLKKYYQECKEFPPFVRQSWQTIQRMKKGEQVAYFI